MRTHRFRRIDRETAERLLDGRPVGSDSGHENLARLLASAATPAPEGEQPGERAALAAFREARLAPAQQPRSTAARTVTAHARRLGVKAALAALTATALGGVALAAGTGHLPGPLRGGSHAGPATVHPAPTGSTHSGTGTAPAGSSGSGSMGSEPPRAAASADPQARLCQVWTADPADRAEVRADPAFPALARAAGGRGQVTAYCATVLSGRSAGSAVTGPGSRGNSTSQRPVHSPAPAVTAHQPSHTPDPGRRHQPGAAPTTADPGGPHG